MHACCRKATIPWKWNPKPFDNAWSFRESLYWNVLAIVPLQREEFLDNHCIHNRILIAVQWYKNDTRNIILEPSKYSSKQQSYNFRLYFMQWCPCTAESCFSSLDCHGDVFGGFPATLSGCCVPSGGLSYGEGPQCSNCYSKYWLNIIIMPRCACACKQGIQYCVCVCLCRLLYNCSKINKMQVRVIWLIPGACGDVEISIYESNLHQIFLGIPTLRHFVRSRENLLDCYTETSQLILPLYCYAETIRIFY